MNNSCLSEFSIICDSISSTVPCFTSISSNSFAVNLFVFFKTKNEADVVNEGTVTLGILNDVLNRIGIDEKGMDQIDRNILSLLYKKQAFVRRNAMGANTICDQIGIKDDDLKGIYEPYLFRLGFLEKTPRGRILTPSGRDYVEERIDNGR